MTGVDGSRRGRQRARRRVPVRTRVLLFLLLAGAMVAVLAPLIAPYDPDMIRAGPPFDGPGRDHLFGTDQLGRDLFSRVVFGARISMIVACVVVSVSMVLGIALGLVLGYFGGVVDLAVSRVLDVAFAFPSLLLALAVTTLLGPGLRTVLLALVIIFVPTIARLVRGVTIAERKRGYVDAARVAGASHGRVMALHILPSLASPLFVVASNTAAVAILAEAALSYLGFGVQAPTPSWGRLLTENQLFLTTHAHLVLIPGAVISVFVLVINLIGDDLRDYLDPRQRAMMPEETS